MPMLRESRFDWRKGLNLDYSQEGLDSREVRKAKNARHGQYGSLRKRAGTQRVHSSAIGSAAAVLGLFQWNPAGTRNVVAIANGNLYHKTQAAANFTEIVSSFSATVRPGFAVHHVSGTPTLYVADGSGIRSVDTSYTITALSGDPAATRLAVYKTRMFAIDGSKVIYWSAIDDATDWAGGGQANVETYDSTGLIGLAVVGSSLLLFKENNIARFTGVRATDIQIDQQTEGVSNDIGAIAAGTIVPFQELVFFVTDRGPYVANEMGVKAIGPKIESPFLDAAKDELDNAVAVHHKGRHEIWVFIPESGETENNVGYCYNYRLDSWTGPWYFSDAFNVCSAAEYELTDLTESVILGGYDGFVRHGDVTAVGAKDDVLSDDTGGTNIELEIELPELFFGDPGALKRLTPTQHISADLKTNGSLVVAFSGDHVSGSQSHTIASTGAGVKQYQTRPGTMGRRITMKMTESTSEIVQINGVSLEARSARRVA